MERGKLTVACLLWVGDFEDRHYDVSHVYRLRDMVGRYLSAPHKFVCLSNVDVPDVETIPLVQSWPGWWAKIELFGPALRDAGRVLYLDLDNLITGSLDEIAFYRAPFVIAPSYWKMMVVQHKKEKPGVVRRYQSSCMAWTPPAGAKIYDEFGPKCMTKFRGDQDYIGYCEPHLKTFDPRWIRKLRQCEGAPPNGCKIVLLHREEMPAWADF